MSNAAASFAQVELSEEANGSDAHVFQGPLTAPKRPKKLLVHGDTMGRGIEGATSYKGLSRLGSYIILGSRSCVEQAALPHDQWLSYFASRCSGSHWLRSGA